MNNMGKVEKMVHSAPNGIITAAQLTKAGLHRGYLHNFVESGELYRFCRMEGNDAVQGRCPQKR